MTNIHDIIDMMRSDPSGVSSKFGIPIRTVYGWCNGSRKAPDYVITMMLNIILLERRLSDEAAERLGSGMEQAPAGIKETCKEGKSKTGPT